MRSFKNVGLWYQTTLVAFCVAGFALAANGSTATGDDGIVTPVLMDGEMLAKTKLRIEKGDPELKSALDVLIAEADKALKGGPYSVTDKRKIPPSGDPHDYASYGRYWWPDPKKADGLPYIQRDGETNPDSQSPAESDRPRIEALGMHTETLGLAYFLTGKQAYAEKAAELLRVWFLDPETRMNPNMDYAQWRPGHAGGSKSGVLDGRMMARALEGSHLIAGSSALSDDERDGLKTWAGDYFHWLTTDELALAEAASENNHGTFYDAQAMYFALYCGNRDGAKKIANAVVQNRILPQIKPDGSMPEELARTRPLFYSNYNLHALFVVANLAQEVGVDVWNASDSRLRLGLDFLVPYADPSVLWPYPSIDEADRMDLFPVLLMGDRAYPGRGYRQMMETLPQDQRDVRRENLVFPLMR
ncbi:poly(beta-D-mannuronate) lyase [Rubripirellula tenax]|uniref:Poly(Beta-D-mannuronate) lyase n=1 Tax=Rubripirellula tenax TaxID=2528015 RepID=A0A5C6E8Y4_9BACT|nr:alginate lyase family protein [Rubripirellula tenax]TWU46113.1 poly(beta-D-mannuronate) lyase [Rubripirellula tenax]